MPTLNQLKQQLQDLRRDPATRRRFPKEFWEAIMSLTQSHPIDEICRELCLEPAYLRQKMNHHNGVHLEFCEITPLAAPGAVTVELNTDHLRAKIQGPVSCLNYLISLFGR